MLQVVTYETDMLRGVTMQRMGRLFASGDKAAHTFQVRVQNADLSGYSADGYMIRADQASVPITAKIEGDTVIATLPEACYAVSGGFSLILRATKSDERTAVFWGVGTITRSHTDSVVNVDNKIPSLEDLLAQIDAMDAATKKIEGFDAVATGLDAGKTPTAAVTQVNGHLRLALGIPKGDRGDTGAQGEKGEKGDQGEPGAGFTDTAKSLILALFESAAYGNADMQSTLNSLKAEWGSGTTTVPVTSVALSKTTLTLTEGDSETLTATVSPANATSKTVNWSVSPAGFATVSGGVVKAVKAGSCTVTASCGGKSAACTVTVQAATSGETEDVAGETPVYKLGEAVEFTPSKANSIDTGIQMLKTLDPKPAYTILFECQYNESLTAAADTYVLLHCMEESSPWPGFTVAVIKNGDLQMSMYGYRKVLADIATLKAGKRKFAIQFSGETAKVWNYDGSFLTGGSQITNYTEAVDKNLLLGGYQTSGGTKGRYFDGVLSQCLIYDKALTSEQIVAWIQAENSGTNPNPDPTPDTDTDDVPGETPTYKLAQAVEITPAKANAIDTGVKLFETIDPKPDWTILLEFDYNASLTSLVKQHAILHCMQESDPWPGLVIKAEKSGGGMQVNLYDAEKKIDDAANLIGQKRRFAFRISGTKLWIWAYSGNMVGNTAGNDVTKYTNTVANSVVLGAAKDTSGNLDYYFDGTIYQCLMYHKALTDEQIKKWVTAG